MNKVLLYSLIILIMLTTSIAYAYETVIIKYPDGELWEPAYYKQTTSESIAQYTLKGENTKKWTKTVIIHAYNDYINTARMLGNTPYLCG